MKYRIVKRNVFYKPYRLQESKNKKAYVDIYQFWTLNGATKKYFEIFDEEYMQSIKTI